MEKLILRVGTVLCLCLYAHCQTREDTNYEDDQPTDPSMVNPAESACSNDVDCGGHVQARVCRGQKCVACSDASTAYQVYANCTDPYGCGLHEYNNSCWSHRDIGEKCNASEECYIYPTANVTRLCNKGLCVCNAGYHYISSHLVGIDKCNNLDDAQLQNSSAGISAPSCLWSALSVFSIATYIGLQHNSRIE